MKPVKTGVLGCGVISEQYIRHAKTLYADELEITACADIDPARAQLRAEQFSVPKVCTPQQLFEDPDIEIVLNLTVPKAHAETSRQCLRHGKHVYTEKPMSLSLAEGRELVREAGRLGLRIGCAPDSFLSAPVQTARKLIDAGYIGRPVGVNAIMTQHGNELWHPDPEFFYKEGAGPMLDMGPYYFNVLICLMGPLRSVSAMQTITFPKRIIRTMPRRGQIIDVEVPTYISGVFNFHTGAIGTFTTTFDVWNTRQPFIEIYGETGTLILPDPNHYTGSVQVIRMQEKEWTTIPPLHEYTEVDRCVGLADMVRALRCSRPHRAGSDMGLHVLEIMYAFDAAAKSGVCQKIENTCARPAPLWEES